MPRRSLLFAFLGSVFLGWWTALAHATPAPQTPLVLVQQGRLLDGQDQPVTATVSITFRLYEEAAPLPNELPLWSETLPVEVSGGLYTAVIGDPADGGSDLTAALFPSGADRYLGITVGSDQEMQPRLRIGTVPLAFHALVADSLGLHRAGDYALSSDLSSELADAAAKNAATYMPLSGNAVIQGHATLAGGAAVGQAGDAGTDLSVAATAAIHGSITGLEGAVAFAPLLSGGDSASLRYGLDASTEPALQLGVSGGPSASLVLQSSGNIWFDAATDTFTGTVAVAGGLAAASLSGAYLPSEVSDGSLGRGFDGASIYNDGSGEQALVITGNSSAGGGIRRVAIRDDAEIHGNLAVDQSLNLKGALTAAGIAASGSLTVAGDSTLAAVNAGSISASGNLVANGVGIGVGDEIWENGSSGALWLSYRGAGGGNSATTTIIGDGMRQRVADFGGNAVNVYRNLFGAARDTSGNPLRICGGSTPYGNTGWQSYGGQIVVAVDTSACKFSTTPIYLVNMDGDGGNWLTTGGSSAYGRSATSFTIYVAQSGGVTPAQANAYGWHIEWVGLGI